jgi:hypothetical protein
MFSAIALLAFTDGVAVESATYALVTRGEIEVKGKGPMHTYFLVRSRDEEARAT